MPPARYASRASASEVRSWSKFCSLLSTVLLSNHFGASSSAAAPSLSAPFSSRTRTRTKACGASLSVTTPKRNGMRSSTLRSRRSTRRTEKRISPCLSFHSEQAIDATGVLAEFLLRLHVEGARVRKVDLEVVGHAGRAGSQHHHPGSQEDRLGNPVRHEHDRLARF